VSTWITVIWKPDGAHGMYSWIHVLLATACAAVAWYSLYKAPEPSTPRPRAVNMPSPGPDAPLPGPDASATHRPAGH
jgi:alpha-1,6-mannosyltransferase